jgi:probable rRNA maturation factor
MALRVTINVSRGLPSHPDVDKSKLRALLRRAARAALEAESVATADISVTLVGDDVISEMNASYLNHEGPTDVISFALHGDGEAPLGDIYIGYEQALRQSFTEAVPPREELMRLTIHGVLHVLGYEHPDGAARMKSEMWQRQESIMLWLMTDE